ncbi:MAG: YqaJ viral recombinase family protein [Holosporaceae bacterium]|jgi:putative phage-type endonuclease|nr:YqaJ viral recombinase family protein [Holosporaceae bacterium]
MLTLEQLKTRKSGIGGSDVAAILGLNKYKTAREIWEDKINPEILDNHDSALNKHIYFGNKAEALIADVYAEKNEVMLVSPSQTYRHREYPFLLANPDRLIIQNSDRAVLECKTCSAYRRREWGTEGTDEMPPEYLLQVAHYRYVMDLNYVALMVLIDKDFLEYRYVKNEELEAKMIDRLAFFWRENVEKRIPPKPMNRRDTDIMIATDEVVEADEELEKEIQTVTNLKSEIKSMTKTLEEHEDSICRRIGAASGIVNKLGVKLCSYTNVFSRRFNTTLFKKEHPADYEQYLKQTDSRVLRIANWGEEPCVN